MNPQAFNRYSYVLNNPLKYVDPTGMVFEINYNWTSQDYMYYCSYGATAMPVEQSYQNMMNNPDLPIKEKSNLQLLHDAQNIIVDFGEYSGDSIQALSQVAEISSDIPKYFKGTSSERYYEYDPQAIWHPFNSRGGYSGEWYRSFGHDPVQVNWEGIGRGLGGGFLMAGGAIVDSLAFGTLIVSASTLNVPGAYYSLYMGYWGYSNLLNNGIKLSSSNRYYLPTFDPVTSRLIFPNTGIFGAVGNLFGGQ